MLFNLILLFYAILSLFSDLLSVFKVPLDNNMEKKNNTWFE